MLRLQLQPPQPPCGCPAEAPGLRKDPESLLSGSSLPKAAFLTGPERAGREQGGAAPRLPAELPSSRGCLLSRTAPAFLSPALPRLKGH